MNCFSQLVRTVENPGDTIGLLRTGSTQRSPVTIPGRLFLFLLSAMMLLSAVAHTLPVSYLRAVTSPDYLHLELIFNPFELSFAAEVDENKDGALDPGELKKHGSTVAKRVAAALKVSVGEELVSAETAGMDPDMSGHHVRLRAHYKVDARTRPVTISSELNQITSSSHLVQVSFVRGEHKQLAQLDSQSRKVTFNPAPAAGGAKDSHKSEQSSPPKHSATNNPPTHKHP